MLLLKNNTIAQTTTNADPTIIDSKVSQATSWITGIKTKSIAALDKKYERIEKQLTQQNEKYIHQLQKQENKIIRKLQKTDSLKAAQLKKNSEQLYSSLQNKIQQPNNKIQSFNNYIPELDSIQTLTKYFTQSKTAFNNISSDKLQALQSLNGNITQLQGQIQTTADIKTQLRQRKEYLQQQLDASFSKELNQVNQQVYYYRAQVDDYINTLKSPDKLASQLMSIAQQSPVFKDFLSKNSWLAMLFPAPSATAAGTANASQALAGLQTRAQVQSLITQQIGSTAGTQMNPQQYLQQQVQTAQNQINQAKDKLNNTLNGGNSGNLNMPDNFKPNSQKTKTFWKRIEYGANLQSQKTAYGLPAMTDFALTAGYKLNDKAIIGIGAAYKLGWGKPLSEIKFTNQGVGLRSYIDIDIEGKKVFKGIWITGGYEKNYVPDISTAAAGNAIPGVITRNGQVLSISNWQTSGLIGLSKKYKVGKKTCNLQILWDFLSYSQIPRTEPIKFRVGYNF